MCEVMRVKPNLQWRLQEVGDYRNMKHLQRKSAGNRKSQPKKEVMWAAARKVIEADLPKPF